ncbi:MAG: cytochrome [Boseongicola sp.]|nr:MAG: cytochrome [Boseongicola sp.]
MALSNNAKSYGSLTRALHWLTALVIFTAFPLGMVANSAPITTDAEIARAITLFSLHKTVGIAALTLGILRIPWSLTQQKPAPIHPDRRLETALAETTHWTLTIALIAVPLSGWISHAASPGLAPILWPFGQSLPFIATTATWAELSGGFHWLATKLLAIAILLHIAGALKHAIIDRDDTLARMTRGKPRGPGTARRHVIPALVALIIWCAALAGGVSLGNARLSAVTANSPQSWTIQRLTLTIADETTQTIATAEEADTSLLLSLSRGGAASGTLDFFALLTSNGTQSGDTLITALDPFPAIEFTGAISGTLPDLTASGTLGIGGFADPEDAPKATLAISQIDDDLQIAGKMDFPDQPGLTIEVNGLAIPTPANP